MLDQKHKKLAYEIYTKKHGHCPEKFKPGLPTPRTDEIDAELLLDMDVLKEIYPHPIVDGPPSNKPITIKYLLNDDEH